MPEHRAVKSEILRLLVTTLSLMALGLAINLFSWRYRLISGGFPGYALSANYITGFPVGIFLLIANTSVLLLSFLAAGRTAGLRGVYGYVFLSLFIDFSRGFLNLRQTSVSFLESLFWNSLQAFLAAALIALIIIQGYSFGSYSSLIPIVDRFRKIPPPRMFLFFDSILALITFFFFGPGKTILLLVNALVFFFVFKYSLILLRKFRI